MTTLNWSQIDQILSLDPGLTGPILLYGPPGTGKSFAAQALSTYTVTLTDETPAAELRGHFLPKGSEFIWHDGPLVRAWREGVRLTVNEIHKASGDVHDLCHVAADHPQTATLTLPTNETLTPAPGFGLIATMNGNPNILDDALLDRFAFKIGVDEVNPKGLDTLPADLREVAKATTERTAGDRLSLRAWNVFSQVRDHLDVALAAEVVLGDSDYANTLAVKDVASKYGESCRACGSHEIDVRWHPEIGQVTHGCAVCGNVTKDRIDDVECCGTLIYTGDGAGFDPFCIAQCDGCGDHYWVHKDKAVVA